MPPLDPSCLAWRAGDTREWYVNQRRSGRIFRISRPVAGVDELGAVLTGLDTTAAWPVVREEPALAGADRSRLADAVAGCHGTGVLSETLRDALGSGTARGRIDLVCHPLFHPAALAAVLAGGRPVLPVFHLDNLLVVGPILTTTSCPCLRCLYGRLYGNTGHPEAFASLTAAVAGADGPVGPEPAALLTPAQLTVLTNAVLRRAYDLVQTAETCDDGTGAPAYTLDLSSGEWRRRLFLPLPGRTGDHAWKAKS